MAMPDTSSGTLYIDGKWRPAASGLTFPVTNPATSEVLAQISAAETQDVRDAVAAAEAAFPAWAARTAYERAGYLYEAHRLMLERADDLAQADDDRAGQAAADGPDRGAVRGGLPDLVRRGGQARLRADDPLGPGRSAVHGAAPAGGRGRGGHPVELPHLHAHQEGRPGAGGRLHGRAQAGRSRRPLCAVEVFRILHEVGVPAGVVNLVTADRASDGGR